MNREQALSYIHGAPRPGAKSGPERFLQLLELLGNPQRQLRFVHIAGTNGKGSTATLLANILRAAGLRTGRFVSPYLERFEERICVDGEEIPERELVACTALVREAAERLPQHGFSLPTEFEVVTALGLLHYLRQGCDAVVLEAGIGGRNDITNVIDTPMAAVITSISKDHTKQLGPELADIARHKAGIVKPGGVAVAYPDQPEEVWAVLRAQAEAVGAKLHVPDLSLLQMGPERLSGTDFTYNGLALHNRLPGRHQVLNTLTAVTAARLLSAQVPLPDSAIAQGVADTVFPGRFEVLRRSPTLVLDGAHNPGGVQALTETAKTLLLPEVDRLTLVVGMMADKDWRSCIPPLTALAHRVILTTPPDPRGLDPAQAAPLSACGDTLCEPDIERALRLALSTATERDGVLVCGSIYLIGAVRTLLRGR